MGSGWSGWGGAAFHLKTAGPDDDIAVKPQGEEANAVMDFAADEFAIGQPRGGHKRLPDATKGLRAPVADQNPLRRGNQNVRAGARAAQCNPTDTHHAGMRDQRNLDRAQDARAVARDDRLTHIKKLDRNFAIARQHARAHRQPAAGYGAGRVRQVGQGSGHRGTLWCLAWQLRP